MDLFFGWGTEDFDNLDKLVNTTLTREERLADKELCDDTADRPDIDGWCVVCGAKNQLRRSVVPRADIGNVLLALLKSLG